MRFPYSVKEIATLMERQDLRFNAPTQRGDGVELIARTRNLQVADGFTFTTMELAEGFIEKVEEAIKKIKKNGSKK